MNATEAALSTADHRRLQSYLEGLASPEPAERALAAQQASDILHRAGMRWSDLVPQPKRSAIPDDWQEMATTLLDHDLSAADRAFVVKVMGWRSPGRDGWERLQQLADRYGVGVDR